MRLDPSTSQSLDCGSGQEMRESVADADSTVSWTSDVSRSQSGDLRLSPDLIGPEVQGDGAHIVPNLDMMTVVKDGSEMNERCQVGEVTSSTSDSLRSPNGDRCPPSGFVLVCGRRREMEDAVAVIPAFLSAPREASCRCPSSHQHAEVNGPLHFFGVYDGHGGSQAALYCADRLHHALAEEVYDAFKDGSSGSIDGSGDLKWRKAMSATFSRMDADVGGIHVETVGSTAVVAVVGSCEIIVANCGDSRAVLSHGGHAIALSNDHKPDRKDEMARVEAAGGRVILWNGYRVLGVLAMSRAIGDKCLKPYVIAEPEVTCTQRSDEDECLILASDGLWDVLSNEVACDIARKCLAGRRSSYLGKIHVSRLDDHGDQSPASAAAALLTKLALAQGSNDNISVVVVDLMTR